MEGKEDLKMAVTNYTNATYVNLTKLSTPPNITVDINTSWENIETEVKTTFTNFSWLEVLQSLGVFAVFYIMFANQKILNLSNMQNILGASYFVIIWNVIMHYSGYYTSFYMLGLFFIIWLVALGTTIKDTF